jgi:diphosphomevalonate decarboxylase
LHGGFVYWHKGEFHEDSYAQQICGPKEFDMNTVIAVVSEGRKEVSSDRGHEYACTSPFNEKRTRLSQLGARKMKLAILNDDFTKVGSMAEDSCLYMHAVMMTSTPQLFYWQPETLKVIKEVQRLRREGTECYFTIDAGPNVHVLCRPEDSEHISQVMKGVEGVKRTITAGPAEDSRAINKDLF